MTLPISVIIPCYRQEQWLNKAIESVVNQADDITIVYDGDGADGYWRDSYPNVYSLRVGGDYRAGVCYARNYGIENATNDLILCLDADDRLYSDGLRELYEAWQPNTWCYGGLYTEIDEDEIPQAGMKTPPPEMIFRKNLTYSSFLFSRDDWARVGGYNVDFEPLEEDYAFQCALVNAGVKAVRVDNCLLYKRMIHTNSRTAQAMKYWQVTLQMCRDRYPGAFAL